jgi:hypothetical protein
MKNDCPYFKAIERDYGVRIEACSLRPFEQMRAFIVHTDGWPRAFFTSEECYQDLRDMGGIATTSFRVHLLSVAGDLFL